MRRFLRWMALAGFATLSVLGGWATWWYERYVVDEPGEEFTRAAILAVIAEESPVYYRDGTTPLGVFFDQEHRRYVRYEELPEDWIHAIVAAEDGNFFVHPGFDPKHILRAAWQNLRAGRVVAGGSTLTQQTAKNLFYRPDRSWRSKLEEAGDALRLEAHFSKEEILEFYANQFHVSANGRGLGIAARYFFDKEPEQLTTRECAFLAGLVKSPATYNPFVGGTPERRERARRAAEERTRYVLGRMREEGYLDEREYRKLLDEPLEFRRGAFQFDRSVVVDAVQRELESPAFIELFERLEIENPATAGLRVITTLDPVAQREATYALWHHLAELGPVLEKSAAEAWRLPPGATMVMEPGVPLEVHRFYTAKLGSLAADGGELDVGGRLCALDRAAVDRAVTTLTRARTGNAQAPAAPEDRATLLAALPAGSMVLASVRAPGICDLEVRPTLQGAAVVLERGVVRAWVGGNDNRNFDRVHTARRQLGSTWKPLVYAAAMQLGWLPTDPLDNRRAAFPFRGQWYYPRPDHPSDPELPMVAAGARSENLATVWLLYHLVDRLEPAQRVDLATRLGLGPSPGETSETYRRRLQDTEGLALGVDSLDEVAFLRARDEWLADGLPRAHPEDALGVWSMGWGQGYAAERARLMAQAPGAERDARLLALGWNLLSLEELAARCLAGEAALWSVAPDGRVACGRAPAGFGAVDPLAPLPPTPEGELLVDGRVHLSTLRELRALRDRHRGGLGSDPPADLSVLVDHPGFRARMAVEYLRHLARVYGAETELPVALSLPLGAAEVSLLEMGRIYGGFLFGDRWRARAEGFAPGAIPGMRTAFPIEGALAVTGLVAEIRDARGNVLFRATPDPEPVGDPLVGEMTGDLLRAVVREGTGRRAATAVELGGVPLPLAGKTGTTNDYRNAAFVGVVPRAPGAELRWGEGYAVAVYVGYDDNRSMRRRGLRVQGANGALPAWIGIARGLAEAGLLGPGGWTDYAPAEGLLRTGDPAGEGTALIPAGEPRRRYAPVGPGWTAAPVSGGPLGGGAVTVPEAREEIEEIAAEPREP